MNGPKVLTLDVELSPNIADVWALFNQNVSLAQLRETARIICWAAKWHGSPKILFRSEFHDGRDKMLAEIWQLIDDADVVVHYNGTRFDMPHLRREFLLAGLGEPSPVREVDLYRTARSRFRFVSNKLDHISRELGLAGKVAHAGHTLWVKCMAGDSRAWGDMRRYNKGDVLITEQVYDRFRPWIKNHPAVGLFTGDADSCRNCGGVDLERRGFACTDTASFQQYRCRACKAWSRSAKAINRISLRGVA